jgi:hypothetical protein
MAERPETVSATDEDHSSAAGSYGLLRPERESPPDDMPFAVWTPKGHQPFYPPPDNQPPDSPEQHLVENDNPFNPKGGPSQHLPQQATPLTSQQGTLSAEDMADPVRSREIASVQDGLAPDNPQNPRGTPDYIVEGITDPDADTVIHQLDPATAVASPTPITLAVIGQGFAADSAVTIDGAPATTTSFVSANRVTAEFLADVAGIKQIAVDGSPAVPFEVTSV